MENGSVDTYQKYAEGNFTAGVTGWGGTHGRYTLHHQTTNLAAGRLICLSPKIFA